MPRVTPLAGRLKELRQTGRPGRKLTQLELARALDVSVPLISSWEHGVVPPPERLDDYARLFARSDGELRLRPADQAPTADQHAYQALAAELSALRGQEAPLEASSTALNPLQFLPGEGITIVCSELPPHLRKALGNASPQDPDYIESYKYADLDALIELLLNIRTLNATNPITVGTPGELSSTDLNEHLIALGGVDFNEVTAAAMTDLVHVPVSQLERPTEEDTGAFAVRSSPEGERRLLKPKLTQEQGKTLLKEDVAHFLRAPNPYNRFRTLTVFNGMYSRGSFGAVQALTHPDFRERNAAYINRRFPDVTTYSIVSRVKIVANEVVVPDWTADNVRLHEWPEEGA
jgi:transcriptional regulator with XRE-family HTH domain